MALGLLGFEGLGVEDVGFLVFIGFGILNGVRV